MSLRFDEFFGITKLKILVLSVFETFLLLKLKLVDEFIVTLTLDISTIFNEGNPKVTSFKLAEEAQAVGAK